MSISDVSITAAGVIESTIIYGFVHTFWMITKWGLRHLGTEAGQIIDAHVKAGHQSQLKHCIEDNCIKLETELNLLRQAKQ